MLKTRNPSSVAPPAAMYSHSVEIPPNARWLVTAGQVGVRPDGTIPDGFELQHGLEEHVGYSRRRRHGP